MHFRNLRGRGRVIRLKSSDTNTILSLKSLLKMSLPVFAKQMKFRTVIRLTYPSTSVNLANLLNL